MIIATATSAGAKCLVRLGVLLCAFTVTFSLSVTADRNKATGDPCECCGTVRRWIGRTRTPGWKNWADPNDHRRASCTYGWCAKRNRPCLTYRSRKPLPELVDAKRGTHRFRRAGTRHVNSTASAVTEATHLSRLEHPNGDARLSPASLPFLASFEWPLWGCLMAQPVSRLCRNLLSGALHCQ